MPESQGCHETTPQLWQLICENALAGVPLSYLASIFNRPLRTIQVIVKRRAKQGDYENAPQSGRPPKLNERAVWHLSLTIHRDRHQSLANMTQMINSALPSPVTPDTMRTTLKTRLSMSKRIAAMKPFINAKQQAKWLWWAKDNIWWTMTDWERIIWTDESLVEIGKESRECTVWWRPGERYNKECLVPTFKSGRQSIMVWGCISYGRQGPLMHIPLDQRKRVNYMQLILAGPLWDYYAECYDWMGAAITEKRKDHEFHYNLSEIHFSLIFQWLG